jgi:hypothetical protein
MTDSTKTTQPEQAASSIKRAAPWEPAPWDLPETPLVAHTAESGFPVAGDDDVLVANDRAE